MTAFQLTCWMLLMSVGDCSVGHFPVDDTPTNSTGPYFLPSGPLKSSISLDTPVASPILTVRAVHADANSGPLTVSCSSNLIRDLNPCDFFTIRVNYTGDRPKRIWTELSLAAQPMEIYALGVQEIQLTLTVSDGSGGTDAQARISLTAPSFPHPPPFLQAALAFDPPSGLVEIMENWPVASPLPLRLRLINRTNGTVTLALTETEPGLTASFTIQPQSTQHDEYIQIIGWRTDVLDRERFPTGIELEIVARNWATNESARFPLTVRLLEETDNSPTFRRPVYNATLPHDAENDQLVLSARAIDPRGGHQLTYTILGPWAKYFRPVVIEPDAVEVRTVVPEDDKGIWKRAGDRLTVVLRVMDGNGTGWYTDAPLTVQFTKDDKQGPTFVNNVHYLARLRERSAELEPPLLMEVYDQDSSRLTFSLDDPTGGVFGVDPSSGLLFVRHPEKVSVAQLGGKVRLNVSVTDGTHQTVVTSVIVEITSVSEEHKQPPRFSAPSYSFVVPAGAAPGFLVGNVIARDPGAGPVHYQLLGAGDGSFALNRDSGELAYTATRQTTNRTYQMTVLASDAGRPPVYSSAELRVVVRGIDTVEPRFSQAAYCGFVRENVSVGHVSLVLKAIDPDAGASLVYSSTRVVAFDSRGSPALASSDGTDLTAFLGFHDGALVLRRSLWGADLAVFHINASVTDTQHPLEEPAFALVIINVIGRGGRGYNSIEFVGLPLADGTDAVEAGLTVPAELGPGAFVYRFRVVERTPSGLVTAPPEVTLTLLNGSDFYSINETTGIVTATSWLTRAPQRSLLLVEASNRRSGQTKRATLLVRVAERGRDVVSLSADRYEVGVPEDAPPGRVIVWTNASTTGDSSVQYSLTGPNADQFMVDQQGVVRLTGQLDREAGDSLSFTVRATLSADDGSVMAAASAPVSVTVLDVNDNAPLFDNSTYSMAVGEDAPVGSYLGQLRATDRDAGQNGTVTYRWDQLPERIDGVLAIDPRDGAVRTKQVLVGRAGSYNLSITATDGAGLSSSVPVSVHVRRVSRCQPARITPNQHNATTFQIDENAPAGRVVGRIRAIADDEGCKVKYTFVDGATGQAASFTSQFSLDPDSGEISSRTPLDRETQSRYTLTVTAKETGLADGLVAQTDVIIDVKDVDDHQPVFQPPSVCSNITSDGDDCWSSWEGRVYNFSVFENEPSGTQLGVLTATDQDGGANARVYYHATGGESASFQLDPDNGTLLTKEPFDYESVQEMRFVVVATNQPEQPSLALVNTSAPNVARVVVRVLDRNDQAPAFDRPVYLAALSNETMPDTPVVAVHATDPDTVGGGVYYHLRGITYHYKGSEIAERHLFTVDAWSGQVRTARGQLSEYCDGYFELTIDSSNAANYTTDLNDSTTVKVWVYSPSQLVRLVTKDSPTNATNRANDMLSKLGDAIGADVILQRVEYHRDGTGALSSDKVDLLAVFVDRSSEEMMDTGRVLAVVDRHGLLLTAASRHDLRVVQVLPASGVRLDVRARLSALAIAMIVLGCVMFVGVMGVILLLCYFRYSMIKGAKKPQPLPARRPAPIVPRRIKENPMWRDADAKPYEEQELSMPVAPDNAMVEEQPGWAYARIHKPEETAENYYQTVRGK